MVTAKINSITRLRIHADGEGVRSVIFMQNCPLSCFWCCNPETRFSDVYKTLTPEQLYGYIHGDVPYYRFSNGGVTFSGGEPLLWAPFLEAFISRYCREFTADIETSLYAEQSVIEGLIPLINQWNVDFKVFDEEKHREFTGVSNAVIKDNLLYLSRRVPKEKLLITFPIIPGYNDSDENIDKMMDFLSGLGLFRIELHPYRKVAEEKHKKLGRSCREIPPLSRERYFHIYQRFQQRGFILTQRTTIYSKEKCAYLKQLRRQICEANQLPVEIAQCTVTEDCIGTCPRCEYELHQIGAMLDTRESGSAE